MTDRFARVNSRNRRRQGYVGQERAQRTQERDREWTRIDANAISHKGEEKSHAKQTSFVAKAMEDKSPRLPL
jgi:hypothetical protein